MLNQLLIQLVTKSSEELLATVAATPDDKLDWRPLDEGRSVRDLFSESAYTAVGVEAMVTKPVVGVPNITEFMAGLELAKSWTREESVEKLKSALAGLVAAVESFAPEQLAETITVEMHRGPVPISKTEWLLMLQRTFISRFAQINYIQHLYGDHEYHN